jgi:hypothetical protein
MTLEMKRWLKGAGVAHELQKWVIHEGLFNKEIIGSLDTVRQICGYFLCVKHIINAVELYMVDMFSQYLKLCFPFQFGA